MDESTTPLFLGRPIDQPDPPWSEDYLQMYVVQRLRQAGYLVHADSNGADKAKTQGARMKAMGALAGWPDITVILPSHLKPATVFFELKAVGGTLTASQRILHPLFGDLGHIVHVVQSSTPLDAWLQVYNILKSIET